MVYAEITHLFVTTKEIALLFIQHEFLWSKILSALLTEKVCLLQLKLNDISSSLSFSECFILLHDTQCALTLIHLLVTWSLKFPVICNT